VLVIAVVALALVLAGGIGAGVALLADSDSGSESAPEAVCPATTVAKETLPSIVTIQASATDASGSGSGEVIGSGGEILTNDHVISSAANSGSITVVFPDGHSELATIKGRDPQTDLAVLKVSSPKTLRVIPFGASSALLIGQPVVVLGAPLGLSNTVTRGIVSALDRSVQLPAAGNTTAILAGAIQTDAAINPGNSGGALVDCRGRLVGVPTAGAVVPGPGGSNGGSIGIGFAIPSDFARRIADDLIAHGSVTHSSFGIEVVRPVVARQQGATSGLQVVAITPGGPSDAAGIQPGDVLTEIDGRAVSGAELLQEISVTKRPGETVTVVFLRDGTRHSAKVTLTSQNPVGP